MNKLIIVNDEIIEQKLDNSVSVSKKDDFVSEIKIDIHDNTDLIIEYTSNNETKLNINFIVPKNVKCNLYELKKGKEYKLGYKYDIDENGVLNIYKINDADKINEHLILNLNGEKAKVNYLLKTISSAKEKYDLMVYHNKGNTESNIINNGVNILNGELSFVVSGFVPNGNIDCMLDQKNRIINLTDNSCVIKPNLFIDENDVIANHSAHIGKCNDDEMFYLMSRGINSKQAENLIIKGFLLNGLKWGQNEMENIINKYWRWKYE